MTKLEQLQKQQAEIAVKQKEVSRAIRAEKQREKRKAEQAARIAEQEEALAVWRFCKATDITISMTVNGEKKSYQLAEYIKYQMKQAEARAAKDANKGGPA